MMGNNDLTPIASPLMPRSIAGEFGSKNGNCGELP